MVSASGQSVIGARNLSDLHDSTGKFASVWKEKRQQEQRAHQHDLLLENAGHATRTPLNVILK